MLPLNSCCIIRIGVECRKVTCLIYFGEARGLLTKEWMQSKAFFDRVPFQVGIFDIGPKSKKMPKIGTVRSLFYWHTYFKVIKVDALEMWIVWENGNIFQIEYSIIYSFIFWQNHHCLPPKNIFSFICFKDEKQFCDYLLQKLHCFDFLTSSLRFSTMTTKLNRVSNQKCSLRLINRSCSYLFIFPKAGSVVVIEWSLVVRLLFCAS